MISAKNILRTVRLLAADVPSPGKWGWVSIATVLAMLFLAPVLITTEVYQPTSDEFFIDPSISTSLIAIVAYIAMVYLVVVRLTQLFGMPDRAANFMTLPITRPERFISLLIFVLVYIPTVCMTLAGLTWLAMLPILGETLQPSLQEVLQGAKELYSTYASSISLLLVPAILIPKRIGVVILVYLLSVPTYSILSTNDSFRGSTEVSLADSDFYDPDVVGLYDFNVLTQASPPAVLTYNNTRQVEVPTPIILIAGIGLLTAMAIAMNRFTV